MKLNIIVRTCSKRSVTQGLKRIVDVSREGMTLRCIDSLIKAANEVPENVTIRILDDHSDDIFLSKLNQLLDKSKHQTSIRHLEQEGFNYSALEQFKEGANSEDLVYLVEDDYLHTKDSITSMLSFFASNEVTPYARFNALAISPFDSPHRYWPTLVDPCRIFYQGQRYWRTITHTSNTIMIHAQSMRNFWPVFETLAVHYPNAKESDTINLLYSNLVTHGGPIACVSPIPSVAYHISYENEPPNDLKTTFTNWKDEWNNYEWN